MASEVKVEDAAEDAVNECYYNMFGQGLNLAMKAVSKGMLVNEVTMYGIVVAARKPNEAKLLKKLFMNFNENRCTFSNHYNFMSLLNAVIAADGMSPEPQKVSVIRNWAVPTDTTTLKSFLGLASYYHHYIHKFAAIAAPLHQLTNKGTPFAWTSACQTSFEQLKYFLTHAPILKYPDFSTSAQSFQLYTDTSATGIGTVLEQSGHVIAYASRTLTGSEKNYSVIQRECLAVVYALKQFRHYLLGRPFAIVTDTMAISSKNGRIISKVGIGNTRV